ncbi:unnamed protein product [Effrenium voratum]|nr:unnamed protein product [Effrenium voratum]
MDLRLDPSFNFNCTSIFREDLVLLGYLPLTTLCSEHTAVNLAIVSMMFSFCSREDGFCDVPAVGREFRGLKARLVRVLGKVVLRLPAKLGRLAALASRRSWRESRCEEIMEVPRAEIFTHIPVANLFECMRKLKDASFYHWQILLHGAILLRSFPSTVRWTLPRAFFGGHAGEDAEEEARTYRSFALLALLQHLASEKAPLASLVAVEIGVSWASTSRALLRALPSLHLILVEPEIQAIARTRMLEFQDRVTWVNEMSREAAAKVEDQSVDLVFIDGDHSYEAVVEDIRAWRRKLRVGGVLVGHDFTAPQRGVVRAAAEFALRVNATLGLSPDCWWLFKPKSGWE